MKFGINTKVMQEKVYTLVLWGFKNEVVKINVYIVGVKSNNSQCCQFTILKCILSDADSKFTSISPEDAQFLIY